MPSKPYHATLIWSSRLEDKWFDHYQRTGEEGHPGFNEFFYGVHDDGSTYVLPDSYVVRHTPEGWDTEFIVVFTEHQGRFVFPETDLIWYAHYENRIPIPELDNDHNPIEDES